MLGSKELRERVRSFAAILRGYDADELAGSALEGLPARTA
jgi:hypothetical protein